MERWLKEQAAEAMVLLRRPGATLAVLGYLIARMSLQPDLYLPRWLAETDLPSATFLIGQMMIWAGVAWFVTPDVRRLLGLSRDETGAPPARAAAAAPAAPAHPGRAD